jgi:outer membrane protein
MHGTRAISVSVVVMILMLSVAWAEAAEKFGFVDLQKIMLTSNAGKDMAADYNMTFEKNKKMIQDSESELKKLQEDIERERPTLPEEVLKERELAFQKKIRDFQILVKDSDEELRAKDQELSYKITPEIRKVIGAIGDREKYTMILDLAVLPIAYRAEANDLTMQVIEEFNKVYVPPK